MLQQIPCPHRSAETKSMFGGVSLMRGCSVRLSRAKRQLQLIEWSKILSAVSQETGAGKPRAPIAHMGCKLRKLRGKWYLVIDYKGHRKKKAIGTSRAVAEEVRRQVEARLALGDMGVLNSDSGDPTFDEYADKWFKEYADFQLKASSAGNYRQYLRLFVSPAFGKINVKNIRRENIKSWLAELTSKDLARNTVRLALCALRVVLSHAMEDGLIDSNPCARLGKFTKTEKPERAASAMTKQEAESFLEATRNATPDYYALFLVALRCGLRQGELIGLKWGDVQLGANEDDPNRYILVQHNFTHGKFTSPKGKRSRRVDLSKQTRRVLAELRDRRLFDAMMAGKGSIAQDLVFPARSGAKRNEENPQKLSGRRLDPSKTLDPANLVHYHFHPSLEAAGLRRFRFHDLRHTFGSLLIQSGASLAYVRDQMGHSSIKITVDCYGHLVPGADIAWVDNLDLETSPHTSAHQTHTSVPEDNDGNSSDSFQPIENIPEVFGGPGRTRTYNQQIMSLLL